MGHRVEGQELIGQVAAATCPTGRVCLLLAFIDLRNPKPLQQAAAALRAEMPEAEIVCVNTPATKAIEAQVAGIDRWITPSRAADGFGLARQLRSLRPAAVCIVYRTRKAKSHLKLEFLAALGGARRLFGAFSPNHAKLRRMCRCELYLRICTKSLVMLLRAGAAAVLAVFAGLVLLTAHLLARPGERLGTPATGKRIPAKQ